MTTGCALRLDEKSSRNAIHIQRPGQHTSRMLSSVPHNFMVCFAPLHGGQPFFMIAGHVQVPLHGSIGMRLQIGCFGAAIQYAIFDRRQGLNKANNGAVSSILSSLVAPQPPASRRSPVENKTASDRIWQSRGWVGLS